MSSVAISQPTYLPWLGYFNQIARSDYFVFLDNVQYEKQSWQCRNRLKNTNDQLTWLTLPVAKHSLSDKIETIQLAAAKSNWKRKHINSIRTHLGKTPYLEDVIGIIEPIYDRGHTSLADLNIALIEAVCSALNIETRLLRASQLNVHGVKTDLLLQIIEKLECDQYHANLGSKTYLDDDIQRFQQAGVAIDYQAWNHPSYTQKGNQFIENLSWVDPVSYLGFDINTLQLLEL